MHVVEHIGLERYGDIFDPEGDLKAIRELERVLKPNGNLLFVVPIEGKMRIQYNAHRIYTYNNIMEYFRNLKLVSFSLITDDAKFIEDAKIGISDLQKYGCGCFWFKK
jgi:SAM-dependent methyltransferase